MRTLRFIVSIVFCVLTSGQILAKDIERYFNNASTNSTDFMSSFSCTDKDHLSEREVRIWISNNRAYFYHPDSVIIKSQEHWVYGARHQMITKVLFVTAANGPKRKNYFDAIKQAKENERLAEIKRREDAVQEEKKRLEQMKTGIENGTFTGKGFYYYPIGKYEGDFVNGKREGFGIQYFTDKGSTISIGKGSYYEGYFKNNTFHGKATYRDSYGYEYTGEYIDGYKHGVFIVYYKKDLFNAYQWKAVYDHGVLISEDLPEGLKSTVSCEDQHLSDYNSLDKTKIKYGDLKDYYGESGQEIKFPDGLGGVIFSDEKGCYLSDGLFTKVYYKDFESGIKGLYLYKKCGSFPIVGRKY